MKKGLLVFLVLSIVLTSFSCKKDSDSTGREALIGTWTLSEFGSDNNGNNKIDTGETFPASSSSNSATLTLNSDNTFTFVSTSAGVNSNKSGTYTYSNKMINLTTGTGPDGMPVHTLTTNTLIVKIANLWAIYVK